MALLSASLLQHGTFECVALITEPFESSPFVALHPQDSSGPSEPFLPLLSRNSAQPESHNQNLAKILRTFGQRGTLALAVPQSPQNPFLVQLCTLRIAQNPPSLPFPFPFPCRNLAQPESLHNQNLAKILRTLGQRSSVPWNPPNPPLVQLCTLSPSRNSAQPRATRHNRNHDRAKILQTLGSAASWLAQCRGTLQNLGTLRMPATRIVQKSSDPPRSSSVVP